MLNDISNFQGLVALLGAVDALSRVDGFSDLKKQVPLNKYKYQKANTEYIADISVPSDLLLFHAFVVCML